MDLPEPIILVKQWLGHVLTEFPIAFPLGFVEELVNGTLVREFVMLRSVMTDVDRLVPGQAGFDIQQHAAARGMMFVIDPQ